MNNPVKIQDSWNTVYLPGNKYIDEPPVTFTKTILDTLKREELLQGEGLYIGCGNGRNFIPLVEEGLELIGLDISDIALQQIADRKPELRDKLVHSSFEEYKPTTLFDYIIAIQVFQHGNYEELRRNFQKVALLLKPGGLFFLRNRSSDSLAIEKYKVIEETPYGGLTVKFLTGSKTGLEIHYLSEGEIDQLPKIRLEPMITPYKVKSPRKSPESGEMVHWEGIWRKAR